MHNPSTLLNLEPADAIPSIISTLKTLSQNGSAGIAQVSGAKQGAVSLLTGGTGPSAGKLRKLHADEYSGMTITPSSEGSTDEEASLSIHKPINVITVTQQAFSFTLDNVKKNQLNIFRSNGSLQPSSTVKLDIADTSSTIKWDDLCALELYNDTTVEVTITCSDTGTLSSELTMPPGHTLQLQYLTSNTYQSNRPTVVAVSTVSEGTSAEHDAVSLLKDGKLRKLYADSNSNLTVVASPDKAQTTISLKRPFNPVSITSNTEAAGRTLEHVKKGHINVFAIANNSAVTNNVELNVDPTLTKKWVDLETLDVLNRTGRDMTIEGTVLSLDPPGTVQPTSHTLTLHAGCAMQLQYIGENRCAVVATAQQLTTDTVSANNEATLIEETSNGTTKLRRVKGEGTVQVNSSYGVITIKGSGDIAQVSGAKQGAVSLLTGGTGPSAGKLRKLHADEYSGMTITPSSEGSTDEEASLSIHKPINVITVTQQAFSFTLDNVKKNQLNIFRSNGSLQPSSTVKLDIADTSSTIKWDDLCALELYNDTTVEVTITCSDTGTLSSELTMPPGHTLQLQYLTSNTYQSNRPTVVAVSTVSEGTSAEHDAVSLLKDGKLRKLYADSNSNLTVVASPDKAQTTISLKRPFNPVSITSNTEAAGRTLEHVKKGHINVFAIANNSAVTNNVELNVDPTLTKKWVDLETLDVLNRTGRDMTIEGTVLSLDPPGTVQPTSHTLTLHAGCAMQLQYIGENRCAVVATAQQLTTDTVSANNEATLIEETSNGTTKLRRVKGEGTVQVNSSYGVITIKGSGDIAQVSGAKQGAVSLLTGGTGPSAGKLRKLHADEYSGMTITPSSEGSTDEEASLSIHKPINVITVTQQAFSFTLDNVKKNQLNIFRSNGSLQPSSTVKLDIADTSSTIKWDDLCALELYNDTTVEVTITCSDTGTLSSELTMPPGHTLQLQYLTSNTYQSNRPTVVAVSTVSEGTSAEHDAVSLLKDGKLRKLYADSNSNLTVVASPDKAQTTISLKRPFNPVSITSNTEAAGRTLEHVKKGHINVFAIANNSAVTNNVKLNVDPTLTKKWVDLETLDVLNRTGRDMTIEGTVLSLDPPGTVQPTSHTLTLHAGCAMQLQYIGENRCAVVATAQQLTTDTVSANNEATLIEETSNGTTKLRRVKGEGTVQVNSSYGVITIKGSGDIAQVSGAKQGAVSLLTGGTGPSAGKLRKLHADEYSGMTITPSSEGSTDEEASLSIHKPINVITVTQQAFSFTLDNVKKNQLNIFRSNGSLQPSSTVKLDIADTSSTIKWDDLCALELYNDTTVEVTITCSDTGTLSSELTMPPGHTLQLQYLTSNTYQSNRPTVVAVSTVSEGTSAEHDAVSLLKDGKLRKLYADSNSNLTVVASPDKAQTTISLKRPFNPVSITSNTEAAGRTLEHVKKGHINVFAIANNSAVTNNVELNVDPTLTKKWVDLETLDVLNRTGRDMTIEGTVLSLDPPGTVQPTSHTLTLHAGCAMQLQYIGENRCAVVATAQQLTTDTVSANNEATLIEETSNGTTKLRRVKGEGTVQVNSSYGVITIKGSGDIAQVSGAKQGAVSLLTGGTGPSAGKLRKLHADEYSGMTITPSSEGSTDEEASLSIHKPINVITVTQQAFSFTLDNVKKNQLNIFRSNGSLQPSSTVKLDIADTSSTIKWDDLCALELYNDTTVEVTITCSDTGTLSSELTMPPGHTLQLQYLTSNTYQSNRPTVVAVSTVSEGTSAENDAVSLLKDGKLRKLYADSNSNLTVVASPDKAQTTISLKRPFNPVSITSNTEAAGRTLEHVKKGHINVFAIANNSAVTNNVELNVDPTLTKKWVDLETLDVLNRTGRDMTIEGTVLSLDPPGTVQPTSHTLTLHAGCAMQLQYIGENRCAVVATAQQLTTDTVSANNEATLIEETSNGTTKLRRVKGEGTVQVNSSYGVITIKGSGDIAQVSGAKQGAVSLLTGGTGPSAGKLRKLHADEYSGMTITPSSEGSTDEEASLSIHKPINVITVTQQAFSFTLDNVKKNQLNIFRSNGSLQPSSTVKLDIADTSSTIKWDDLCALELYNDTTVEVTITCSDTGTLSSELTMPPGHTLQLQYLTSNTYQSNRPTVVAVSTVSEGTSAEHDAVSLLKDGKLRKLYADSNSNLTVVASPDKAQTTISLKRPFNPVSITLNTEAAGRTLEHVKKGHINVFAIANNSAVTNNVKLNVDPTLTKKWVDLETLDVLNRTGRDMTIEGTVLSLDPPGTVQPTSHTLTLHAGCAMQLQYIGENRCAVVATAQQLTTDTVSANNEATLIEETSNGTTKLRRVKGEGTVQVNSSYGVITIKGSGDIAQVSGAKQGAVSLLTGGTGPSAGKLRKLHADEYSGMTITPSSEGSTDEEASLSIHKPINVITVTQQAFSFTLDNVKKNQLNIFRSNGSLQPSSTVKLDIADTSSTIKWDDLCALELYNDTTVEVTITCSDTGTLSSELTMPPGHTLQLQYLTSNTYQSNRPTVVAVSTVSEGTSAENDAVSLLKDGKLRKLYADSNSNLTVVASPDKAQTTISLKRPFNPVSITSNTEAAGRTLEHVKKGHINVFAIANNSAVTNNVELNVDPTLTKKWVDLETLDVLNRTGRDMTIEGTVLSLDPPGTVQPTSHTLTLHAGCAMQLQYIGENRCAVVATAQQLTTDTVSANNEATLIEETSNGTTKLRRVKGEGTVQVNSSYGVITIKGSGDIAQVSGAKQGAVSLLTGGTGPSAGKLRKLHADEYSGMTITPSSEGSTDEEASLSIHKPINVITVTQQAFSFTLDNVKKNQLNIFRSNGSLQPSSTVKLDIADTSSTIKWDDLCALELYNDTTVEVTITCSDTGTLSSELTMPPGHTLQLQYLTSNTYQSNRPTVVAVSTVSEGTSAENDAVSLLKDGKLRKLYADSNSNLTVVASPDKAQTTISLKRPFNPVSITSNTEAAGRTLEHVKKGHINVFAIANNSAVTNNVKLNVDPTLTKKWVDLETLDVLNRTGRDMTIEGTVLSLDPPGTVQPTSHTLTLHAGCAMQLQYIGENRCAVVATAQQLTTDTVSANNEATLIEETSNGTTKLRRVKGEGTVQVNSSYGVITIKGSGDIAQVSGAKQGAVSLLTGGTGPSAGKLRKLHADEYSGMTITPSSEGSTDEEASLSIHKPINVITVTQQAFSFTLDNVKKNQLNIFRSNGSLQPSSTVKLDIADTSSTIKWDDLCALELYNDTTVEVTITCSDTGTLSSELTMPPGHTLQLQYLTSNTYQSNRPTVVAVSTVSEGTSAEHDAVSLLKDGKLRKLYADSNSNLTVVASPDKAQTTISLKRPFNPVSITSNTEAAGRTLEHVKKGHINVFAIANNSAVTNNVELNVDPTLTKKWVDLETLDVLNRTGRDMTIEGTVLSLDPPGSTITSKTITLHAGCAMQLQYIGNDGNNPKVAVVSTGQQVMSYQANATNSTAKSLIQSTQDGVTKLMRLQGAGTVTINEESPGGVLKITGSQYTSVTETDGHIADVMAGRFNIHTESTDVEVRVSSGFVIGSTVYLFNNNPGGNSMRIKAQSGQSINSPFGYDAIKPNGLGILTKIEDSRYSLSGDLTYKQIMRNHQEGFITDSCIGRCNRMNGPIELRNIGREGDEIHIYAESAVEIRETTDTKLTKNHQKHDSITKQGMATLRKISSTDWVLSGDTFRSDRNNLTEISINTNLRPEHIGRFNVYAPDNENVNNDTNRVHLGFPDDTEAANMREGDEIEIYNSGSVVLEVLPTISNHIQIWSVDSNTKVKPKGAAILKYMGKKSQNHTWALIGAIE